MEYTVNASNGTYDVKARVASNDGGGRLRVEVNGTTLGTFDISSTGGWGEWRTVTIENVTVSGGERTIRLTAVKGGFNLNWIAFVEPGSTESITPTPTPTPAKTATPTPSSESGSDEWPKVRWWYECSSRIDVDIYWEIQVLGSQWVTETYGSEHWETNFPRTLRVSATETHTRSLTGGRWIALYLGKDTSGEPWARYDVPEDACKDYGG
jgi:hypothetical protein